MTLYKELDYSSKIRDIVGVQFSVLSPEEIKRRSVVHVTQTLLYDSSGDPVIGGLFDPRMGVIDHGKICPTDGLDNRFCPGYFGHIELCKPVFHIQFLAIILKVLKCVCIRCSKLLINKENQEIFEVLKLLKSRNRWNFIIDKCSKVKICGSETEDGCGALQPTKIMKETNSLSKIYAEWREKKDKTSEELADEEKKQLLTAEFILKVFRRISDEDCEIMGFSRNWCRPDWMICTNLPVSPPSVRPSIRQFGGQRSEDDITHKLHDIVKTNNHLKKKLENGLSQENTIDDWMQVLQYHVATLVDNELPGINPAAHRSGRALKTLRQRLKGKEGRIRGNLMGKRVDFSARSVITPDPNLQLDELGVPFKVAKNLTYPEIVTKYNINKLYSFVRNGPFKHPGAKSIKKKMDGRTTSLQHVDVDSIVLDIGDVVHRHIMDGDIVLFNRQPSLHKMSMMGHRVKVMEYHTFRLNVSVTKPYNADFDGDEMNMHVPQSIQTATELKELTYVPLQIISPRIHKPVIGLFQDSLLGLNRITDDNVYFTKAEMMNILIYIPTFNGIFPAPEMEEPERWSGRQLISFVLPSGLNMNMKNGSYDDDDTSSEDTLNHVIIKDGKLVQGRFDTKIMDTGSRGLIHTIFNDYGHKVCQRFLDDLQNIVTRYLILSGFSVGISDLIADRETNTKIKNTIVKKKKEVSKLVQQVHQQIFENNSANTISIEFEKSVNNTLNKAISEAGKIGLNSLAKDNRMINMVSSGSKGKTINIAQMVACVGQQNIDGKRIPNGYNERALPHFTKYNVSPEARGFVESSFIGGLSPQEFFFHAMGGREGLIDTAVKTSETGYIQRKLIKAMEDLKVKHNLSVVNAGGTIIQFLYGEDGMDYGKIETQHLEYFSSNFNKLERDHKFSSSEDFSLFMNKDSVSSLKATKSYKDRLNNYFKEIVNDYIMIRSFIFKDYRDSSVNYPINLARLISNIKTKFDIQGTMHSDLSPIDIIERINKLVNGLKVSDSENGMLLFQIMLRAYLSPKQILKVHKFNRVAFDYLTANIEIQFDNAMVQPGEMVGPIAAQSIGEPATQMTLNTFHFAGVSEKSNVTRGVPRLKELLHISKSIKMPSLTIYLEESRQYSKDKSLEILNKIELTTLKDITKSMRIFYDPNDYASGIDEDRELLQIYKVFNEIDAVMVEGGDVSKWIIRFELDKQIMMDKNITMEDIYHKIDLAYGDCISCIYSDDNSNKLIFRIRLIKFKKSDDKINDLNTLKAFVKSMREKIIIKGVDGINSISMYKNQGHYVYKNMGFEAKEEWVLDTNGINLLEVLRISGIDPTRTISNDIHEVYEIFGIEAAKNILMKEIKEVIVGAGSYVNYRHLSLLVDTMTNRGHLMSIDRFGINRGNIGPLAKCSFEETTDQLFKASIFGEVDKLTGVSANIMMGQIPPCGTGETDILIDESKLMEINPEKEEDEFEDINTWGDLDYCDTNVTMGFNDEAIEGENVEQVKIGLKTSKAEAEAEAEAEDEDEDEE
jgi:DNA-directed RNA polymerase II subunit RPB1